MDLALQRALFNRLTSDAELMALITAVYDDVPQTDDSGSEAAFPYVVIGDDDNHEWDTDTTTGKECLATIHTWSRTAGRSETRAIQDALYHALHMQTLTYAGCRFEPCYFQRAQGFLDVDGRTRHGVSTFRILFDFV